MAKTVGIQVILLSYIELNSLTNELYEQPPNDSKIVQNLLPTIQPIKVPLQSNQNWAFSNNLTSRILPFIKVPAR